MQQWYDISLYLWNASRAELLFHCLQGVAKNMGSVTKALEKAVNSMELEKITEVEHFKTHKFMIKPSRKQKVMDKFEKTFEDLDVHTSVMEGAMAGATATTTLASQVFT